MKKDPTPASLAKAFHAFGGAITEDGPVVRAMQRIMFDARQLDERTPSTTNTAAPWVCIGCGKEAVGKIKSCDCPSGLIYQRGDLKIAELALTQQQCGEQEAVGVSDAAVEAIIDRVGRENSIDGMDGDSWDRLLVREALRTKQPAASEGDGIGDKARLRDYPKLLAFFTKHALGTLAAPSCLCCGQSTQGVAIGVQHMELPAIVICAPCVETSREMLGEDMQPETVKGCRYNTSKQAAGETVGYVHVHETGYDTVLLQQAALLTQGKHYFYFTPPRHPADEGVAVVAEYLAARDAYEEATNPSRQKCDVRYMSHDHPIARRIQAARAALRALVPKEEP